jgi:type IV pilus assembly protein PilN
MIYINLLPWRETLKKRKRKENLLTVSLSAGFAVSFVMFVVLGLSVSVSKEESVVEYLNDKISSLDKNLTEIRSLEVKKTELITKTNVLQKLQMRRTDAAQIFDELVIATPDEITLFAVQRTGNRVDISGFANSNSDVSQFMKNIERSTLLHNVHLIEIEKQSKNKDFSSRFYVDFDVGSI